MKTIKDLKEMIAEPASKEWFEKHGNPSSIMDSLRKECAAYLERNGASIDSVEEGDDGVFYYQRFSNNAETVWEVELPSKFNQLFK